MPLGCVRLPRAPQLLTLPCALWGRATEAPDLTGQLSAVSKTIFKLHSAPCFQQESSLSRGQRRKLFSGKHGNIGKYLYAIAHYPAVSSNRERDHVASKRRVKWDAR